MRLTTAQRERAAGVLVGQACGDALGVPYEFGSPPRDGRPEMLGGGLGNYAPGEWSDDTQMAMCIAEVAATGIDLTTAEALDAIAGRFEEWLAGSPGDVGIQTRTVLTLARSLPGSPSERLREAARQVHHRTGRSAGNGALMRTSPVALAYLDRPAELAQAARAIAELTHYDPLAGDACVLWSDAIQQAVTTGEGFLLDLELIPTERRDYWAGLIADALEGSPRDFNPNGDTMRAFQAALAVMVGASDAVPDPVRKGLTSAVLAGHDTDTVAAIAGGLLGGLRGLGAVPAEWVTAVHGWPGRRGHDLVRTALAIADPEVGRWPDIDRVDHVTARPLAVPLPFDDDVLIGTLADLDRVDELGVSAVVTLCRIGRDQVAPGAVRPERHAQLWLVDSDDPDDNPNLYAVLTDAARLTRSWRDEGHRVLIHCVAAQRRAPSAALAYAGAAGAEVDEAARGIPHLYPGVNATARLWRAAADVARELAAEAKHCQSSMDQYEWKGR